MSRRVAGTIGPLMGDVAGLSLTAEDREVLSHPSVGGVILFARNYRDTKQLAALCKDLLKLKRPRLLLAVDHEGGRVQRFREGFTRVPAMRTLGALYEEDKRKALADAKKWGRTIGKELAAFGIDLCFAPVLDRDTGKSQVIGDRAFASDIPTLVALARAFVKGLDSAGLAATGKHFPGHGSVTADSHHELPVDGRRREEIEATELAPFKALIDDKIPSLMLAHVRYRAVDEVPASLSHRWIHEILRKQMKYDGALFCDDLSMGGAQVVGDITERARLALAAGCDMALVCNDRPGLLKVMADLPRVRRTASSNRLKKLYRKPGRA